VVVDTRIQLVVLAEVVAEEQAELLVAAMEVTVLLIWVAVVVELLCKVPRQV
jgi:hypothetical protein